MMLWNKIRTFNGNRPGEERVERCETLRPETAKSQTSLAGGQSSLVLLALAICIAFWCLSERPSYAQATTPAHAPKTQAAAISVETFGPSVAAGESDPPAIVLIPGLSCGGDVWEGVVKALEGQYALHVVTLAGFAGTNPLLGDGPFLETVRDALIAYIVDNNLHRPAIVGHSLGAFLAYWIASTAPDQVGAVVAVDGLPFLGALQNPSTTAESAEPMAERMASMFSSMTTQQFVQQNEMALRSMIRDTEDIARIAVTSGQSEPASVGRAIAELMTTDLRDALENVTAPVLQFGAFAGLPTDEMRSNMRKRYQDQISGATHATFVEAPTLHFVMIDDLDFFLEQLTTFFAESWPAESHAIVQN